ncbi:TadG family pilus assembly protein [Sphingomonas sp. HITSZ_GF]|uniref:TadG family pilus assembly protein n=1 Tax=Sphingomonas sp. HITSZ_GF TaxID=3037247 RepID=UPI00240DDAAE|nr:TadG family pilus assembly protein [Sphingomonas sp. HITSZ_GF]MDG2532620.1 TadG family pilus assembly protein [Sphingomonas sp. HITSZ_GF]
MLFAGGFVMLAGSAAFAVDTGSLYLEKRRLQGVADAAALSAASSASAESAARSAISANQVNDANIEQIERGSYSPDTSLTPDARFSPSGSDGNAVRLTIGRDVPLFFGKFLTGRSTARVSVRAVAARVDLASFSIGSRLASVGGGLPGQLLSSIAGTDLNINVMDANGLVNADVDILAFSDALRTQANLQGLTFGETLASNVSLPKAITALASAVSGASAKSALHAIAVKVPPVSIKLSQLIDLGPLSGESKVDPNRPINASAYALVREALETATGKRQLDLDLGATIPGVASTKVTLAMGEREAHSPWLAVAKDNSVKVRTAQTRLYVDARVGGSGLLSAASVHLPIFVELAKGEASLHSISCPTPSTAKVSLDVTAAAGQIAIGDIDTAMLGNFNAAIAPRRTTLVKLLGIAEVTGQSNVTLGGTGAQKATFTAQEIAAGTAHSVSTHDLTAGVAVSLIRGMDIQASALGIGINLTPVTSAVGTLLQGVAAPIDSALTDLTGLLGVNVGQADVRVNGLRCGKPILVG